jgi:two-component system response regulator VicR
MQNISDTKYKTNWQGWRLIVARIFIVEDDIDLNAAYRMILTKEKHQVDTAFNGDEALAKVTDFKPDLILLDLLMPVKSGVEFLQEYDVVNKHKDVKVLIFTNLEHASEIHEAFRLGADQCVIKAWTAPQGLVKIVVDVLGGNGKESAQLPSQLKPAM